jgi:hypothetical protein
MRFHPSLLLHIATLVVAGSGCSSSHGSCDGFNPQEHTVDVDPSEACSFIVCREQSCSELPSNGETLVDGCRPCGVAGYCYVPNAYLVAWAQANPPSSFDSGVDADTADATDASTDAGGPACPAWSGVVTVRCTQICEGRRTAGMREATRTSWRNVGEYFACCAHLEAVSVFAFARMVRELEAHGAPRDLIESARRARRDEIRHARAMRRLALRRGCEPERAHVEDIGVRSLFDLALENAIEGCVRETFGAVSAHVRAARASDPEERAILRSIADDECEHAALSWRVAAWASSSMTEDERARLHHAMRASVNELLEADDDDTRRIVTLLDDAVFRHAA